MKKDLKNKKREFVILLAQGNITYFLASNTLSHSKVKIRRNAIREAKYFLNVDQEIFIAHYTWIGVLII